MDGYSPCRPRGWKYVLKYPMSYVYQGALCHTFTKVRLFYLRRYRRTSTCSHTSYFILSYEVRITLYWYLGLGSTTTGTASTIIVSGKPASKDEFAYWSMTYDLRLQYRGLGSKPFLPALDSTLTSNNFDGLVCIVLE